MLHSDRMSYKFEKMHLQLCLQEENKSVPSKMHFLSFNSWSMYSSFSLRYKIMFHAQRQRMLLYLKAFSDRKHKQVPMRAATVCNSAEMHFVHLLAATRRQSKSRLQIGFY